MSEASSLPPVPADLDLRDFQYMPLDVLRLRDSDLATLATGDEFKAAVLLWCAAWHQVPCGSLPNDDRWLARHSGAGAGWRKVKAEALRGFTVHSDGRLYHSVVVEKAMASWRSKCEQRVRTLKARIAKAEKRAKDAAATDDERAHQQALLADLRRQLPQAIERSVTTLVATSVTDSVTSDATDAVTASKGKGEGKGRDIGKGEGDSKTLGAGAPDLASKVFSEGVSWLETATGKTNDQCRALIGSWRKKLKNDDATLIALIASAQRQGVQHPESWMTEALKPKSRANGGSRDPWAEGQP